MQRTKLTGVFAKRHFIYSNYAFILPKYVTSVIIFLGILFCCKGLSAQSLAQKNAAKRYEIDAKRMGTDMTSRDALPRSREFIRTDSTYYVGWMYEGMYKATFAADYLGFKNAVAPLSKALDLLERDYKKELRVRSGDLMAYYPAYKYQMDYTNIAYQLMDCYSNIEQPDEVYALLRRAQKWNFQNEGNLQTYCYLAWTTHRNRFYTTSKYNFLKNNVEENEALAQKYLDSAMRKIAKDAPLNHFFNPQFLEAQKQGVYHYRAILYSYNFQMDSARRYYNLMKEFPFFSHNNYAIFLNIDGDFRESLKEFETASYQDGGDKRLQEWAYYSSILNIYQSKPQVGAEAMRDMIQAVGSTPGFGWYNIALARCCQYNGDIEESERYIKKAEGFKEIHIGTTLGQSHYDFSVNLVKLRNAIDRIQMQKFEHSNWWYNPAILSDVTQKNFQKYLLQYLVVNQFAMNPERDMVVYKLFSSESTIAWDEVWYLIRDFTTNFFLKKYQFEDQQDKQRPKVKHYFQLFVAKMQMEKGNYEDAEKLLNQITQDKTIDEEYEQLFVARVFESLALCSKNLNKQKEYHQYLAGYYAAYPQLVPFSDMPMDFRLNISGNEDSKLVSRLKDCNINWDNDAVTEVNLSFSAKGNKRQVSYSVTDRNGHEIVKKDSYVYDDPEKAGVAVAYLLFKISGKLPESNPDQVTAL